MEPALHPEADVAGNADRAKLVKKSVASAAVVRHGVAVRLGLRPQASSSFASKAILKDARCSGSRRRALEN